MNKIYNILPTKVKLICLSFRFWKVFIIYLVYTRSDIFKPTEADGTKLKKYKTY